MQPVDRLILALDVPTGEEAIRWVERLKGRVGLFKIGLRLFVAEGPEFVRRLRAKGAELFLDLKLHDIPSTVEATMRAIASLDVRMTTIHATGGHDMVRAAVDGGGGKTEILAVTMLTSIGEAEQQFIFGGTEQVEDRVLNWANMAIGSGADGLVASPLEAAAITLYTGQTTKNRAPLIVTPGIRMGGGGRQGDQARTAGPREAIEAGASHLVVGRPILGAKNPEAAAEAFVAEIAVATGPVTTGPATTGPTVTGPVTH